MDQGVWILGDRRFKHKDFSDTPISARNWQGFHRIPSVGDPVGWRTPFKGGFKENLLARPIADIEGISRHGVAALRTANPSI